VQSVGLWLHESWTSFTAAFFSTSVSVTVDASGRGVGVAVSDAFEEFFFSPGRGRLMAGGPPVVNLLESIVM